MTVLCVAALGTLPGVPACSEAGEHRVTCPDHPGFTDNPGRCRGCLPRSADRGYLCTPHYERMEAAYLAWGDFARLILETDGRAVSPEAGGKATPDGYSNLPLTFLALDECTRLLASRKDRTLDVWVHTEDGARDAIMFAHAAENAYRTLQVEEHETVIVRERCPNCGYLAISRAHTTRERAGTTIVSCNWCGHELSKVRTAPVVPPASEGCEGDDHEACGELACRCACHDIGRRSRPQGITALWDADEHTLGWVDRSVWVWDGETLREQHDERKTA